MPDPQMPAALTPPPNSAQTAANPLANIGTFSPIEVSKAFRAAFPQYKPELADPRDLYTHLRTAYPDQTKQLVDPLLEGSENLPLQLDAPPEPKPLPTMGSKGNLLTTAATSVMRMGPPLATSILGPWTGGTAWAASGAAGLAGEAAAQGTEEYLGIRDKRSPATIGTAGAFNMIPGVGLSKNLAPAVRVGVRAAEGAGIGLVQQEVDRRLEGLAAPGFGERAEVAGFGMVMGAGFGAYHEHVSKVADIAAEATEQIRRRALTREGLAQTISRFADTVMEAGHGEGVARQYAAKATRAVYQGRPIPDPPKAPELATVEPPPTSDTYGPFDASTERVGDALETSLKQPPAAATQPPAMVTGDPGFTTGRPFEVPAPPAERKAGQALAEELKLAGGKDLAADISGAQREVAAQDASAAAGRDLADDLNHAAGADLAADIKKIQQGELARDQRRKAADVADGTRMAAEFAAARTEDAAHGQQLADDLLGARRVSDGADSAAQRKAKADQIAAKRASVGEGTALANDIRSVQQADRAAGVQSRRDGAQLASEIKGAQQDVKAGKLAPAVLELTPPPPASGGAEAPTVDAGVLNQQTSADIAKVQAQKEAAERGAAAAKALQQGKPIGQVQADARRQATIQAKAAELTPPPASGGADPAAVSEMASLTGTSPEEAAQLVQDTSGQRILGREIPREPVEPAGTPGPSSRLDRLMSETGALHLDPPPPVDFDVAPGDTPRLKQWMAEREGIFGSKGWYKDAAAKLAKGDGGGAWQRVMAERVRQLPKAERSKLVKFGRARGELTLTPVGEINRSIPQPPNVKQNQRGKVKMLESGLLASTDALPDRTEFPTLTAEVVGQIARRADRAKVATIAGNKDAAYRVSRQIVHQMLTDDPSFRSVREVLGMSRDDLARGFQAVVTDSARTLQKLSAFAREAPPAFVEKLRDQIGDLPADLRSIESDAEAQTGVVKLYGGLMGISPEEAAEWIAKAARAQDALHTEWMLSKELPADGPLRSFINLTNATLTGTVEQFWRNGLMGVLRWNVTGVRDLIGAGYAGVYDPAEAKILFSRAKDRLKANGQLINAWADPWARTMTEMWPELAGSLHDLPPGDVRHTLKWLSEAPEQSAMFLGRHDTATPVNSTREESVMKFLQLWNRMQEFPLRAIAMDTRMRTEIRRRGFDPNAVIAQGVPLGTIFGGDDAAARALTLAAKDGLEMTYAGSPIKGTWNAKVIKLFQETPVLNLFARFPRFAWSAGPRQLWDLSPASLTEFLTTTQNRGRFTHGRAVRKAMDTLIPAREQRLNDISQREGDILRQRMSLTADRRVQLRAQQSLEAQIERAQAGEKTKLPADQLAAKLADIQGKLRSTTNTINALQGAWKGVRAERKIVLEQKKNLTKAFDRSSDASGPESVAEVLGNATVGSLLMAGAYQVYAQNHQQDLPWYQIRLPEHAVSGGDPAADPIVDLRAFGGFAQYFYLGHTAHEVFNNWDQSKWIAAKLEGKSIPESVDAAYTGKYDLGSFLAEGAQALLSMNPTAGAQATLLDFLQPQHLDPEGFQTAMKDFVGEMVGALFQPLTSYKNLASAAFPEEATIRDFTPSNENPSGGLGTGIGKIPGADQLAPAVVSQTSGKELKSEKAWTRPVTGLTFATPPNEVESEIRRTGVPFQAVNVPRLKDTGLNQELSRVHAATLKELFGELVFGNETYEALKTPEERRRYLTSGIGNFAGVLPLAKKITWARMQEYGPIRLRQLRGLDAEKQGDLLLLQRWVDQQGAQELSSRPPAPATGTPPGRSALPPPAAGSAPSAPAPPSPAAVRLGLTPPPR